MELNTRSRGWIVVINNWTDDDCADVILEADDTQYLICGFEVGEQGTPHLQMYFYYNNAITGKSLKKRFPRAHLEPQKGTNYQARKYINDNKEKPDAEYCEFGVLPYQGKIGMEELEVAMKEPEAHIQIFHQYRKTYDELKQLQVKKTYVKTEFYVLESTSEWLEKILMYFGYDLVSDGKYAVITSLDEMEMYNNCETIIYYEFSIVDCNKLYLWAKGIPITYKYGYQQRRIKPKHFVVVGSNIDFWYLNSYVNIDN